jgi:hypothetical protein
MEKETEKPREPDPERSWSPVPQIHSKLDWMEEVPFRYVRGVEIHTGTAEEPHPSPA